MADNTAASVNIDIKGNIAPFEAALAKARQMADLFDQQVSKKLGNTGASEAGLAKIAGLIEQTNAMLAKMTGVVNTTDASMNKFAVDAVKASASVDDVRSSAASAAPAVGKLSSEFNSAASSIQRAVIANQQFTASNRSLAAASNLKLADGSAASVEEMQAFAVALDDIRAKYNPLFKVTRDYLSLKDELRIATKLGALSEEEAGAALSRTRQETLAAIGVLKGHTDALKGHGAAAGLGATQMMALTHAVRSFTEQIAMGASPLQALTAQMNHLSYVASGSGGVAGALNSIGEMALGFAGKFARFGLVLGGAVTGFLDLRDAASEAERRTVGFGETFTAIFQTIGSYLNGTWIGAGFNAIVSGVSYAFGKLKSAATDLAEWTINAFRAVGSDMAFIWNNFPTIVKAAAVGAANALVSTMEGAINKVADAINRLNNAFGGVLPQIEHVDLGRFANPAAFDLAAKNAEHMKDVLAILNSTPIRDFGKAIVDRIETNHALEGLDKLANVDFGKSIGGATGLGNTIGSIGSNASGVTVTIGGMAQQVINVTKAFEDAKRAQLGQLVSAQQNLIQVKQQATELQQTLAAAGQKSVSDVFGSFFSDTAGARQAIADAASGISSLFQQFDAGRESASQLNTDIEKVRATLLAMGGDPNAINAFINSLVNGQLQARQLKSNVDSLSQSIRSIPNRTVTITIKTQRIGSGTQSLYDVPNESGGGTSQVGVTRYGGDGSSSGPSITANQVPSSGYGSQGGSGDTGTSTVNVWRFATGGMIHPGDTQQVSFFKSPDETVGIFTPGQMQALADPRSGFTGTQPTQDIGRIPTTLLNVEANTKKTAQILDEIKTATASSSSALSGSASFGSSSGAGTTDQSDRDAYFMSVFKQYQANFQAAGVLSGQSIGYGLGSSSSPFQIALKATQAKYGFNSGGMIAPGDTQQVQFFKSPEETVAIFTPQQMKALRGDNQNQPAADNSGDLHLHLTVPVSVQGGPAVSNDSVAEIERQFALALRQGLRSINGR
jgi:hypothetical protein